MKKIVLVAILGVIISGGLFISSCTDNKHPGLEYMPEMYRSPDYEAYSASPLFSDSMSARHPVAGTIPRGWREMDYPNTNEGYEAAGASLKNPLEPSAANHDEGKRLFNIYCIHCHGEKGDGQGTLSLSTKGGEKFPVPSYYDAAHKDLAEGKMFFSITYGKNLMGSHASQISPEERWKIIMHIQDLQKEGLAGASPAPADTTKPAENKTAMK